MREKDIIREKCLPTLHTDKRAKTSTATYFCCTRKDPLSPSKDKDRFVISQKFLSPCRWGLNVLYERAGGEFISHRGAEIRAQKAEAPPTNTLHTVSRSFTDSMTSSRLGANPHPIITHASLQSVPCLYHYTQLFIFSKQLSLKKKAHLSLLLSWREFVSVFACD